ncbi:catechol 2,3-dioxygenase-like lactoylglutathione lyase family enzyme [Rhizobium pisi]|uniref:Catechol 2,3-dioxygenase-like lactoylglutathione lyase family enzyme n=2 Tax=Rhizobium TaxID=379 RepID=A0A7W6FJQ6_9HYPH|nr:MULTISPECIES: VOC family protein [Rhizobium]MBB3132528.1 catechol 2,3-dioxygenase-like lactoylglutathione lyase family enzyme [Rhizobium pisi]MBB3916327.1 catechol 2,3-dioxygenase-like lactoylglutathione lyase family enzyme [Rhizobium fabae]RSB86610.1 glyoxalase [Rhizobium pisi]RUM13019.1 glyoxalase [Rhizobium fabae]TCA62930.1 glyoxalase [Rhizobium pisi]
MPRLDHVTIETRDAPGMIRFLEALLGVKEGYRPPFASRGHWLYLDERPVIHLSLTSRSTDFPPGIVNHFAFSLYEFEPALERIKASGYRYEYYDIPDTDLGQIFVYGPEGVKIELQYPRPA